VNGIIHGAGWGSEVKNELHLAAVERLTNVELPQLEPRLVSQVTEIGRPSGQQVVNRDDPLTLCQQGIAKV
jgi:hypothetical protein